MPAPSIPTPLDLDSCVAAWAYDRESRAVLTGLKNGGERALIPSLADLLVPLVPLVSPRSGLLLTWAPTGARRRRQRGFDQAELLARAVARRGGWRVAEALRRLSGPPQAGRSVHERRANPAFVALRRWRGPVVVVDDVATTGATLSAAARALRAAGATEVHGVVLARAVRRGGE